jgi:hypothetical protein
VNLGKFAIDRATMKFVNRFLGEILTACDVDCLQPAFAPPPPRRYLCDSNLRQPF